jgi:predicted ATPase/DNA-binding SARP family transcriptional activator
VTTYRLLGALEVLVDGQLVDIGHRRQQAVLIALLASENRPVPAETLIDRAWGEDLPQRPRDALYGYLSRLRQLGIAVSRHPNGYLLRTENLDLQVFRGLVAKARTNDDESALVTLDQALDLWRGPIAVADTLWLAAFRDEVTREYAAARLERDDIRLRLGHEVLADLTNAAAESPWDERRAGQLMLALHRAGRRVEALDHYQAMRKRLADEIGTDPGDALKQLHQRILVDDPTLASRRANLPAPLTSFVGRAEELRRIHNLLKNHRLVTLTGTGGMGKTRLAIEAAKSQNVWFVDLTSYDAHTDLAPAIVSALGLRDATLTSMTSQPALDRLVVDRPTLLVLDNCEHLLDTAAQLAHLLLVRNPKLRILATSREPMGITGEALCPVPPLDSAAQLFADRASAVAPDVLLDTKLVAQICETLDGLPLAIELAAARMRDLPLKEIAARLDDRFRLLSRGSRTAAPRHRTLKGVVAWSWELLAPAEQRLAAELTVFSGAFTPAAVETICGDAENLSLLAEKSLIDRLPGDELRYRMLSTIAAFCAEKLEDEDRLRAAHATYFLAQAEDAAPHLLREDQLVWLQRLAHNHDNLHSAIRRSDQPLRFFAALLPYWWLRGERRDSAAIGREILARNSPEASEEYALCLLNDAANDPEATDQVAAAEAIIGSLDRPVRHPFFLLLHELATGRESTIARADLVGDDPWAHALLAWGSGCGHLYVNNNIAAAEKAFETARLGFQTLGDRWGMALTLSALATMAERRNDYRGAVVRTTQALDLAENFHCDTDLANLLRQRAANKLKLGDGTGAAADYRRASRHSRQSAEQ